jgi:transposase
LFRWRRKARESGRSRPSEPAFLPLAIAAPPEKTDAPVEEIASSEPPQSKAPADNSEDNRIEIELANGRRIRVGAGVDTGALRRILALLDTL